MAVDRRAARMSILALVSTLLMGAIGARVWFLQVVEREGYQAQVNASKIREVTIVPERGRIFDSDGRILAGNEAIKTLTVEQNVIRNRKNRDLLFERLSGPLGIPVIDLQLKYNPCYGTPEENDCRLGRFDRLLPFPLVDDVNEQVIAYIKERSEDFPGVEVTEGWRRVYPYAPLASHVVGYMGAISSSRQAEYIAAGYRLNERVGQFWVELTMEQQLRGIPGKRVYEIDSNGRVVRQLFDLYEPPIAGNDIQLTIDLDIQQYAEQALETKLRQRRNLSTDITAADRAAHNPIDREARKLNPNTTKRAYSSSNLYGTQEWIQFKAPAGAVVIEDYTNGHIVAMASYPTFDNRWMSSGVSSEKFEEIFPSRGPDGTVDSLDPDLASLVNRAVQARYNLGSSIKPFIAWSALHSGIISPGYTFLDTGTYTLETIDRSDCQDQGGLAKCVFKNATSAGTGLPTTYGPVNVTTALAVSSDAFFYRIGEKFWKLDEDAGIRDERGCTRSTLKEDLQRFGFGSDSGVQLPYEWDGRIPDDCVKQQLIESGALAKNEVPRLVVGDNVQVAIGQGLMAATPLQIVNAYATLGNGGTLLTPTIVKAILAPFTPDGAPGYADVARGIVVESYARPRVRDVLEMDGVIGPIDNGLRQVITGPGTYYPCNSCYHATTGEKLFEGWSVLNIGGKTGTTQGAGNYPWNDSAVFGAYSRDSDFPYAVVAYLEKSGYGGRGAAPVAKCLFEALVSPEIMDPVLISDPLDVNSTVAAPSVRLADDRCLEFRGSVGRN